MISAIFGYDAKSELSERLLGRGKGFLAFITLDGFLKIRTTSNECKKSRLKRSFSIANTPAMCKEIGGSRNGRLSSRQLRSSSRLLPLSYPSVRAALATLTHLQLPLYSELLDRLSVRGRFKRQPHVKLCAIRTRGEVDFSVMPFDDDPVADHQAESRA